MREPQLSVVMPVRNVAPYIDQSIASILDQTFTDFEFVILDDASTDRTAERLEWWARRDGRLRVHRSEAKLGPVGSSQRAVELGSAPLIARMDGDDVAHPERLARQVALFRAEPEAALCGTLNSSIYADGRPLRMAEKWPLTRPSAHPPVSHASIMVRRTSFAQSGGYRPGTDYWEDLDLYRRMASVGRIFVIPSDLMAHRWTTASSRSVAQRAKLESAYRDMAVALEGADGATARMPSRAYILSAMPLVMAGERPGVLGRFLNGASASERREWLSFIGWALWAEFHPGSLRWALGKRNAIREWFIPAHLASAPWLEWRPGIASVGTR